jgi:hypothetical protein
VEKNGEAVRGRGSASDRSTDAGEFAANLDHRREAANDLEKDLLTEVPLLYGSPGSWGNVGLARIRREEMLRRSGEWEVKTSGNKYESLPFERATGTLAVLLFLFVLLAKLA